MITKEIGIDLGSSNTRIYIKSDNKIIKFKSLLAIDRNQNEILCIGEEASKYSEKEPENIILKRPIKKGKIDNVELVVEMIREVLKKNKVKNSVVNPNILISYDRDLTEVEKNALIEVMNELGTKNIYVMDIIKLIAFGISMDISRSEGNMIIDIGYETTRMGIVSSNNIVNYKTVDVGGNSFNNSIIDYLKVKYKTLIGNSNAENIKMRINDKKILIEGRNQVTGSPSKIEVTSEELKECMKKIVIKLTNEIKSMLEFASPEIFKDISNKGIVITGGGSKLHFLREMMENELNIPVLEVINSEDAIINGIKYVLDYNIDKSTKI